MSIWNSVVLFVCIWWVVLFAVLPLGVRPADDSVAGTMSGAPEKPDLKRKFLLTTAISTVVWGLVALVIAYGGFSLRDVAE